MKVFLGFMYRFHRIIGIILIVPVVFFISTGLLLEFREGLALHEIYPENAVVLWLYGSERQDGGVNAAPGPPGGYEEYSEEPASYERVLTAFHSGRLRGSKNGFLIVTTAFLLLIVTFTGLYLWIKRLLFNLKGRKGEVEDVEEELMESAIQLTQIKSAARGLYTRAVKLHNLSEHVMEHVKDASGGGLEKEMGSIEGHMKDLDARMHSILEQIEKLGVKSKRL